MYFFECLVYVVLCEPTLITLALAIYLCEGAAGDAKGALFSTGDTEHPGGFLKGGDKDFPYLAAALLYLDAMPFWTAPKPNHQMANSEVLVVRLGRAKASGDGPSLA